MSSASLSLRIVTHQGVEAMTENVFEFDGASGVPFTARMVTMGQGYGSWDGQKWALNHGVDRPMVEFYDRRSLGRRHVSPHGQFISRYFLETLKEPGSNGLLLDTGSPDWNLTFNELYVALRALESKPRHRAQENWRFCSCACFAPWTPSWVPMTRSAWSG